MEKIYGTYPGNIEDLDHWNTCSPAELYLAINSTREWMQDKRKWLARRSAENGIQHLPFKARSPRELTHLIGEAEYAMCYLIALASKRFGFSLEGTSFGPLDELVTGMYVSNWMRAWSLTISDLLWNPDTTAETLQDIEKPLWVRDKI